MRRLGETCRLDGATMIAAAAAVTSMPHSAARVAEYVARRNCDGLLAATAPVTAVASDLADLSARAAETLQAAARRRRDQLLPADMMETTAKAAEKLQAAVRRRRATRQPAPRERSRSRVKGGVLAIMASDRAKAGIAGSSSGDGADTSWLRMAGSSSAYAMLRYQVRSE